LYYRYIKDLDWIVCGGTYIDELDSHVKNIIFAMFLFLFAGIIIFFHVLFFVCIAVFIYVFTVGPGDSKFFTDSMAYICLFSLIAPIFYMFIKTSYEEYSDFKQTKVI